MRNLVVALVVALCCAHLVALPDVITIGGIFDRGNKRQELAFRNAIKRINSDPNTLRRSQLHARIERMPADDSFKVAKSVCEILRSGVAAIFGPQLENTANHVQSICDAMEVPHIETRWDYKLRRDEYSINLYPHPTSLSKAYYDVIKKMGWTNFVILYDSNEGLIRLQPLLKDKDWIVSVRQLSDDGDWRPLLKQLKKTQKTKFVIDVAQDKIQHVLKQAAQIGLMREYHSYFLTTLDLHLVDLEDYRYGGTNITTLRLVDPNNPSVQKVVEDWKYMELRYAQTIDPEVATITTESALIFDAVHLFAMALNDLDRSREVDIANLYCEGDKTWQHGNSLINYMKWYGSRPTPESNPEVPDFRQGGRDGMDASPINPRGAMSYDPRTGYAITNEYPPYNPLYISPPYGAVEHGFLPHNLTNQVSQVQLIGLTGVIKFDRQGFRTDFELDILELDSKLGLHKVGVWTLTTGANYTRSYEEITKTISLDLRNRTLIVTTALTPPYTMLKEASEPLVGNDQFEGFCVDIIDKIAESLGFNYTFQLVSDGAYGSRNKETGEWNGMVRELLDHKADLGIVDFTITYEREEAVDFSMPFMNLGISIIYKKPQKKAPSLFSFMSPFSVDVWIYMATSYLGVSVLLFILARITPNEWDNPHPCIQDPDELENTITLSNAFWFTIGSLMQQGSDIAPKAVSTRIVAGIWWFFTLIMISSYTANLAAFLTVERMESPIEGADDLAKQTKIKYGCKEGGSTYGFFRESKIPTYQRMWAAMSNARPTVFTQTNDDGVERVSKADGMYAFLMESSSIEYEVERRCDLMQVGSLLDSKSYGIALPPGSPYTGAISSAILRLKETGQLHGLKKKWWKERKGGGQCAQEASSKQSSKAAELGLANVGGVFVVLIGGMGISAVTAICEFLWNARELATDENASFCEELGNEVKFIIRCSGNTKPVRKKDPSTPEEPFFTYGSYGANYGYSGRK